MIDHIDIANVLFLDIETVSAQPDYDHLSTAFQELWQVKAHQVTRRYDEEMEEEEIAQAYTDRAAIYAEFGKIICISVGAVYRNRDDQSLRVRLKSFAGDNEAELLHDFSQLVTQYYNDPQKHYFCGHNIREFDMPYICRRMIVNQLPFPNSLQLAGKKPWELKHLLDTLDFWRFGDNKSFVSLKMLAALLDFPSPKEDIDGSQVGRVYWEEQDIDRISHYCERDVLATIQLFLRFKRMPLLDEEQVSHLGRY